MASLTRIVCPFDKPNFEGGCLAARPDYIVELPLGGVGFTLVLLAGVVHLPQPALPIQGITVHANLGVQAVQIALFGNHQRNDFDQG